jgi:hypothetical protein
MFELWCVHISEHWIFKIHIKIEDQKLLSWDIIKTKYKSGLM